MANKFFNSLLGTGGGGGVTPIALIDSVSSVTNALGVITTSAIDTTGATLLIATTPYYDVGAPAPCSITDSKGNTWSTLPIRIGSSVAMRIWYVINPTVGSGHTFTSTSANGSDAYASVAAAAFNLTNTASNPDANTGAGVASGGALTIQPGSITPTENNCLLVAVVGYFDQPAARAASIGSGFTLAEIATSAINCCVGLAYKVQDTATAENPTWTVPINQFGLASAMAAFKHS